MALGDGIRRNVATISADERHRFRDAIIALNHKFYPGGRNDNPTGGVSFWFKQDEIHANTHVHSCPAFIPWHRELMNRFEDLLREVDPLLSLHYWDWNTDPTPLFTSDFMGSAHGDAGQPWLAAGLYNPAANPFRSNNEFDPNNNPFDPPRNLTRAVAGGAPNFGVTDDQIRGAANFPSMNGLMDIAHGGAHGYIGGTIGNAHTSFRDPFVFLLHSNLDRIFAEWQLQAGHPERLNPETVYGADTNTQGSGDVNFGNPNWGILSPLEPWAGPAAQSAATGIVANVHATRPWAPPEQEQLRPLNQKSSKHYSVVIPPAYDTFGAGGSWAHADLTNIAGGPVAARPTLAGYAWGTGGSKQLVYLTGDGHVHELFVRVHANWLHADLTAITGAPAANGNALTAYSWETGASKQVVYLTGDGHIHELFVHSGGAWGKADLTQITGAPPATGNTLAAYSWEDGLTKQVVYLTGDGHIHELFVRVGGAWGHADLSALTGAPAAAGNRLSAYGWEAGGSKQVIYTTGDGHIHELFVHVGGAWGHADLSALTGAPPVSGPSLTGYGWDEGLSKQVAFLTADGHVHELFVRLGGAWAHADLTAIAGGPSAPGSTLVGYSWKGGSSKQVVFLTGDGHVHELWVRRNSTPWAHADLTQITAAPAAAAGSPISAYSWYTGGSKQVIYLTADGHVHEMFV